jgi:cell division protein FtsL
MANYTEVHYINAYVSGTCAPAVKPKAASEKKPVMAKLPKNRKLVIPVDPVAIFGIVVACVMTVMLMVGFVTLNEVNSEYAAMEQYVSSLQEENVSLQTTYDNGYDIEQVRQIAESMGMVSIEQVPHISLEVTVPVQEAEPTPWETFLTFLAGLFA